VGVGVRVKSSGSGSGSGDRPARPARPALTPNPNPNPNPNPDPTNPNPNPNPNPDPDPDPDPNPDPNPNPNPNPSPSPDLRGLRERGVLSDGKLVREAQQQPAGAQLLQRDELYVRRQRREQRGHAAARRWRCAIGGCAIGGRARAGAHAGVRDMRSAGAGEGEQRPSVGAVGEWAPHPAGVLGPLEGEAVRRSADDAGARVPAGEGEGEG
jgi:hypothetical protein